MLHLGRKMTSLRRVVQYFRSYKSSLNTGHATTWLEPGGSSPWRQAEKSSTFPVLYGRFTCKQNGQKCFHVPQNSFFFLVLEK